MVQQRILVVDDERAIVELVGALLQDEGYRVITELDSRRAFEMATEDPPDLILLDMRMPLMDGWEFARQLAAGRSAVPIVVMTAAQHAREWADEIGAAGFVGKPFEIDRLIDEVARVLAPPREQADGSLNEHGTSPATRSDQLRRLLSVVPIL